MTILEVFQQNISLLGKEEQFATQILLLFTLQAILDKATTHTKSLLQKSEERVKALEKVSSFFLEFMNVLDVCTLKKKKRLRSIYCVFVWIPPGSQQFAVGSELQPGPNEEIAAVVGTEV